MNRADQIVGREGNLEMVLGQEGGKPSGKGLVNHPIFSSKWIRRAKV
jgi:hypothetical protein